MEKFLEELTKNEQLMEDFLSQDTPEGLYSVAKPYIGNMSEEEFTKSMAGLSSVLDRAADFNEMDEDQLAGVSGGKISLSSVWSFIEKTGKKASEVGQKLIDVYNSKEAAVIGDIFRNMLK